MVPWRPDQPQVNNHTQMDVSPETKGTLTVRASLVPTRAVLRVVLILLVVAGALWVVYQLTTVILLLVLSIFFAYLVAPLVDLAQRPIRIGGRARVMPRGLAIGLAYLVVFGGVGLAIYFLVPRLASQFPEFAQQARAYWKTISASTQRLNEYFKQHRMPQNVVDAINSTVPSVLQKIGEYASAAVTRMLSWLAYLPWLVLIPILSFFLLKDAQSFRRAALRMLPSGRWRWRGDEFFQDINRTLAAYIRAQLTACFFIGVITSLGFALIGLPSPLVLGFIAGALEFVPLVGPLAMILLTSLLAVLHSGFGMALAVLLFLVVLRVVQDYVIYPRIIGRGIHLHPLAVILAILAGAELAGVAGIFLAIPTIAVLTVTCRNWLEYRGSEGLAEVLGEATAEPETIVPGSLEAKGRQHSTSKTTAAEMARARPDLTTGELKMPRE